MNKGEIRKDHKQIKVHKAGKSVYLSLFGGDGTFEVHGLYDENAEWPHIPFKVVIAVRNEDEGVDEGAWGHGPLDNDAASDWKWDFGDLIIKELKTKLKIKNAKEYLRYNELYYAIGMWEFFRKQLETQYTFFTEDEVTEMDDLTIDAAEFLLTKKKKEWSDMYKNPKYITKYLEHYIERAKENNEHNDKSKFYVPSGQKEDVPKSKK